MPIPGENILYEKKNYWDRLEKNLVSKIQIDFWEFFFDFSSRVFDGKFEIFS